MPTAEHKRMEQAVAYAEKHWMGRTVSPGQAAATAVEEYVRLSQPELLTTVEELEALPRHTIISYGEGYYYIRLTRGWFFAGPDHQSHTSEELVTSNRGPFTVIHRHKTPD